MKASIIKTCSIIIHLLVTGSPEEGSGKLYILVKGP